MQVADFRAVAGTDAGVCTVRFVDGVGSVGLHVRGLQLSRGEVARVDLVEAHQRGKFGPF